MTDIIVVLVVAVVVALASFYIYRSKKSGNKCVGCPVSKNCSGSCCDKKDE